MELRQLRYFIALAKEGNYLNAAADLYISQSQLSKKIMALEEELGVTLIDRSKRKIAVTQEGQLVLKHAAQILGSHDAMIRELAELKGVSLPTLTILSIPVMAPYQIPALLAEFRESEPGIQVQIGETEANEVLPALVRGDAEIGIFRKSFADSAQFDFAQICEDEVVLLVPLSHHLAGKDKVNLAELGAEKLVLLDKHTLLYRFYLDLCRRKGIEPDVVHTSTRTENIIEMVASGLGVSLMMRRVVEYFKSDAVCQVTLTEQVKSQVGVVWRRKARLSQAAERFIAFVSDPDRDGF